MTHFNGSDSSIFITLSYDTSFNDNFLRINDNFKKIKNTYSAFLVSRNVLFPAVAYLLNGLQSYNMFKRYLRGM